MKVWFYNFQTEAHRKWQRGFELVRCLEAEGIECTLHLDSTCDVALCGTFWAAEAFDHIVRREQEFRYEREQPRIKVCHICWDLYRANVSGKREGMCDTEKMAWARYVCNLATATDLIIAPSKSAKIRMHGTHSHGYNLLNSKILVVKSACDPWYKNWPIDRVGDGGYVVDVCRKFGDVNDHAVKEECEKLKIPCIELDQKYSWNEFQIMIAQSRLLVCAYQEASTGGLALLEGYALGKPVLLSDAPANGGKDYFGNRAAYFRWNRPMDLARCLEDLFHNSPSLNADECRSWVSSNYSDESMASQLAIVMREGLA